MVPLPPPLPSNSIYTSCYCEENVYLLCKHFLEDVRASADWEPFVIFISNHSKTVALWQQKLARDEDSPVVWDYHVVLVLRLKGTGGEGTPARTGESRTWVYDFDYKHPPPLLVYYLCQTFSRWVDDKVQSLFRVVPGQQYVEHFASDRSHMIIESLDPATPTRYSSPPPLYPPIQGRAAASKGITNNLMAKFVCMKEAGEAESHVDSDGTYGRILTLNDMLEWCLY